MLSRVLTVMAINWLVTTTCSMHDCSLVLVRISCEEPTIKEKLKSFKTPPTGPHKSGIIQVQYLWNGYSLLLVTYSVVSCFVLGHSPALHCSAAWTDSESKYNLEMGCNMWTQPPLMKKKPIGRKIQTIPQKCIQYSMRNSRARIEKFIQSEGRYI